MFFIRLVSRDSSEMIICLATSKKILSLTPGVAHLRDGAASPLPPIIKSNRRMRRHFPDNVYARDPVIPTTDEAAGSFASAKK